MRRVGLLLFAVLVPYFGLLTYLAMRGSTNFPAWARWVLPAHFVASMIALTVGFSKLKRRLVSKPPGTDHNLPIHEASGG